MSTKYQKENDTLGYYVEGDYMAEELNENQVIFSQENSTGFRLLVSVSDDGFITRRSLVLKPNNSLPDYVFEFDNKEDWENFCEAVWKSEHYMAVRKKDFIEFFQALRHLHGHHCRQLDVVAARQKAIDKEVTEQQEKLEGLSKILKHYEDQYTEAYNESKV